MNCITPGLPVHHQLPEPTQTHFHWVSDAIQPSHPLSSTSPAPNSSQHQGLFKWVSPWWIMHWSRGYHALFTCLSCTDHVTDHALITWRSCTAHVADHAMITQLPCTGHMVAAWSLHDQPREQCIIATWSVHDQSRDLCMISHVISAWSVTWPVHGSYVIIAWSATWSVHDRHVNSAW